MYADKGECDVYMFVILSFNELWNYINDMNVLDSTLSVYPRFRIYRFW